MNFRYRKTNSIYEGDMNASICSRYHEQFFTICTILSFEISIDTDYPPFHTARWILLLKRRSRKKTLKSIIVPSKFNSILYTSTFLIYIFQTIATSIQKYNLSNNQKKKNYIYTRNNLLSTIYLLKNKTFRILRTYATSLGTIFDEQHSLETSFDLVQGREGGTNSNDVTRREPTSFSNTTPPITGQ